MSGEIPSNNPENENEQANSSIDAWKVVENAKFSSDRHKEELSEDEQTEVEFFKKWYADEKRRNPDATEAGCRKTIISGLGYHLGIPGYGLEDADNADIKPTEEQQARLEELYGMVVASSDYEIDAPSTEPETEPFMKLGPEPSTEPIDNVPVTEPDMTPEPDTEPDMTPDDDPPYSEPDAELDNESFTGPEATPPSPD